MNNDLIHSILEPLLSIGPFVAVFFLLNLAVKYREEEARYRRLAKAETEEEDRGQSLFLAQKKQRNATTIIILIYLITILFYLFGVVSGFMNQLSGELFVGLGTWIPSSLAILLFIPGVRRFLAKLLPIDPKSPIHTISLALSILIFIQLFIAVGVGINKLMSDLKPASTLQTILGIWTQNISFSLLSLLGVGWLTRRKGSQLLERLGLKAPNWKDISLGLIVGVVFAGLAFGSEILLEQFGILPDDSEVDKATEKLIGPLLDSLFGILTLGLAAALGEELIFRGALLPRFGVLYTSILFTFIHIHYGFSMSTIIVFALGIFLAFMRKKYSTTVAMIIHATYNIVLGILSVISR